MINNKKTLHGFTREEFIGLHLTSYIHPDSQRLFTYASSANGILYSELRQQLSSALMGASLLHQYKRKEQETLSINRELVHYRENLEKMVVKRTEELTLANERLQQEVSERKTHPKLDWTSG